MAKSPEELAHLEWLGYVQPVGLVVSIPALLEAQCYVNKNVMGEHARFLGCLATDASGEMYPEISDFTLFVQQALDWQTEDLVEVPRTGVLPDKMTSLEVILPQYNETLRPTHVVPAFKPAEDQSPWVMLIQEIARGAALDEPTESDSSKHWNASPHAKFERLLRESGVPIGLLFNGRQFRLVYAPRGETSGYATFSVDEMAQVAGRPMFAAFQMLLGADRVFNLAENQRLPHILANSRKYQNVVSTALAEQVTSALFELLRGFQAANDQRDGQLLREILANNPQHVYHGLLTVLMRLVFVLYAEDRGLVSSEGTYTNHYSVSGLFERLRSEAGRFPDTMDQRFGAWAQLLTLYRLIHEGGQHAELKIPPRKGYLFDPDRYPFLEGRFDDGDVDVSSAQEQSSPIQIPHISDGVIYRVLEDLLVLDGERLSYRTLDVEQIGSVYEAIMGFELQVSRGKSIAIKPVKAHGAPATIDLESLLAAKPADRAKRLKEWTDQKLAASDAAALKAASSIDELVAALEKKIAKHVTPGIVPADSMVFQPSDERRRSGSHYTPRSLTEPIVRTTLEPILKQLCDPEADPPTAWETTAQDKKRFTAGEIAERIRLSENRVKYAQAARQVGTPHPSQILDLKICDPAMGSGAFLVEACRQLGDELIKAWYAHPDHAPSPIGRGVGGVGIIPPDEDEVLYARRLIAQRCLYGVDKNVMAVDLAKLSLWLVTLARDHAFTFLDHALRHGDSLVGLTREQIIGFHWEVKKQKKFGEDLIQRLLDRATEARAKILGAREDVPYRDQAQRMALADEALDLIRLVGDACVSSFFDPTPLSGTARAAGASPDNSPPPKPVKATRRSRDEAAERLFGFASSYLESRKQGKQVDFESRLILGQAAARLRALSHPIPAFHWEIEFPEVFARENGGFDAFVGNPPFLGGTKIGNALGDRFRDWLLELHDGAHGNSDLVCYFFRRAFDAMRASGHTGLIATNTIAQGDTRRTGLQYICKSGGEIYSATKRLRWPGQAAVVVSVIHFSRTTTSAQKRIDSRCLDFISAHLFHRGSHDDPLPLSDLSEKSFIGVKTYGQGFVFDDTDDDANPQSLADDLMSNPKTAQRIFPYIGGSEINSYPDLIPRRRVMNLGTCTEEEARENWPELVEILEAKVKPARAHLTSGIGRRRAALWWQYGSTATRMFDQLAHVRRAIVCSQTSKYLSFVFMPSDIVFTQKVVVICMDDFATFANLQSRAHQEWAFAFGSSMKDDPVYTPSDCFDTFPFLKREIDRVATAGEEFYSKRNHLMQAMGEGLTDIYNRFHDPHEQSEGILELRRLHGRMDSAVLRAYGWDDLAESARCEFLLDYEEEEDDESLATGKRSKKKKPWRLRWPDEFRDEVLARLLELNEKRHKEEQLAGESNAKGDLSKKSSSGKAQPTKPTPLFHDDE